MAGYTRNDTPNNIADGNVINASDLDGEFDSIQTAFGTDGHTHDGTAGNGPQIGTGGLADNAVTTAKIAADAINGTKIADDVIDSEHYVAGSIDAEHLASNSVTSAKLDTNIQIAGTLGVTGETTLTTHLNMGDNDIIKLGDSADLQIYHDGSSGASYITETGAGNLIIKGTNITFQNAESTETYATFVKDGGITLTYDGLVKFITASTGIQVFGDQFLSGELTAATVDATTLQIGNTSVTATAAELNILDGVTATAAELNILDGVTATAAELNYNDITTLGTVEASKVVTADANGNVLFPDNEKANFGTSNDLQIYHNGINSYIEDTGTGDLYIRGSDDIFIQSYPGENAITVNSNASVDLYYNGLLKLSTLSDGVNIEGSLYIDDYIFHAGDTNTYLQFHSNDQFRITTGGTEMLEVNNNYVLLGSNTVANVNTNTVSGTQTPSFYVYNSFVWTLTGNITLNNPTTEVTGMSGVFIFIQGGSGGYTVSLGTDYETTDGQGLTLSTVPGSVDIVPYFVQSIGNILLGKPQLAFS